MTAAQPDPYEIVRLLSADTFTRQEREQWVALAQSALAQADADLGFMEPDTDTDEIQRTEAEWVVDALLAHIAAQLAHLAAQQTRAVLYEIAARTLFEIDGGTWPDDCTFPEDYRKDSEAVVDALLAHIAAQPGGGGQ